MIVGLVVMLSMMMVLVVVFVDDELTPLLQLQDLHLERGLLWPREAAKPIEAPSVK